MWEHGCNHKRSLNIAEDVDTLRKLDGSGNNHLLLSVLHCVKEINHTCMHVYYGMPI